MTDQSHTPPASFSSPPVLHFALVGGGDLCMDLLEKTTYLLESETTGAKILAVADDEPESPALRLADSLGFATFTDYKQLYRSELDIELIVVLTPDQDLFQEILKSRPAHIRILSYEVFNLFWQAIGNEEKKLRERNLEVEAIINGIQDFILVISPEKGILDVNQAFLDKMGYSRSEVIGKKCYEIFQKSSRLCSKHTNDCPLYISLRNKKPHRSVMTRVNRSGRTRYFEVTAFPMWRGNGGISKFIEISRDITEQKKAEEEITQRLERLVEERTRQLEETHAKLMHQDKMASLGKLAASVVHEINNPNAGILNLIILIKRILREGPLTEKELDQFNRYLDLMETENRRISRIVSNLLAFSRQSQFQLTEIDINQLIEKTLFLNANLLKINSVKVEKQLAPSLPRIVGSEDHLQQVFMNFVSNAAEAMESVADAVLTIRSESGRDGRTLLVSFTDTGVGIPKENIPRLFEPFYTTKKKGKGVGLGLSVAYGIVKDHQGDIWVDAEEGNGATFTVKLPLNPDPEENSDLG